MKTNNLIFMGIAIMMVILFSGCADVSTVCPAPEDHVYGFWGGLWHGMTIFFSFFGQLFSDNIAMYAVNNNGGWYNFGFFIGIGGLGTSLKIVAPKR